MGVLSEIIFERNELILSEINLANASRFKFLKKLDLPAVSLYTYSVQSLVQLVYGYDSSSVERMVCIAEIL